MHGTCMVTVWVSVITGMGISYDRHQYNFPSIGVGTHFNLCQAAVAVILQLIWSEMLPLARSCMHSSETQVCDSCMSGCSLHVGVLYVQNTWIQERQIPSAHTSSTFSHNNNTQQCQKAVAVLSPQLSLLLYDHCNLKEYLFRLGNAADTVIVATVSVICCCMITAMQGMLYLGS